MTQSKCAHNVAHLFGNIESERGKTTTVHLLNEQTAAHFTKIKEGEQERERVSTTAKSRLMKKNSVSVKASERQSII